MVAAVYHIATVPAVYGGLSVVAAVYLHNYRLSSVVVYLWLLLFTI